ncbi:MAG: hypothetical protein HRT36_00135, partial [Alphaproteobacteria bacterium]|nr:hypothetical protein [Alphaproteobacteria bacterium]
MAQNFRNKGMDTRAQVIALAAVQHFSRQVKQQVDEPFTAEPREPRASLFANAT